MALRIQLRRSSVSSTPPSGMLAGELAFNEPDRQVFFGDATGTPTAFVGVRIFSASATYGSGDIVNHGGALYCAPAAVTPGAFNPAQWTMITLSAPLPANAAGMLTNDGAGHLSWSSLATIDGGTF